MEDTGESVICRDIYGVKTKVRTSELSLRVSIYGIVLEKENVLVVPQWDGYDFPGGGIHLGEEMIHALKREVKEETGLDVKPVQHLLTANSFFTHPHAKQHFHSFCIYYLCNVVGGKLSDEGFVGQEREYSRKAMWVNTKSAMKLKFYNSVHSPELLRDASGARARLSS